MKLCGWRPQVLLTGRGKNFCAGIDLTMAASLMSNWRKDGQCPGRAAERSRLEILRMQDSLTTCERCRWPVVAAVHGTSVRVSRGAVTCHAPVLCPQHALMDCTTILTTSCRGMCPTVNQGDQRPAG